MLDLSGLRIKNYHCACSIDAHVAGNPHINLYIQSTAKCNGSCEFCSACDSLNTSFDFSKLEMVLSELPQHVTMGKVSITGGEPLLDICKTKRIISIVKAKGYYTVLNTNGYSISRLKELIDYIDEVNISRHHFENSINDSIMHLKTPSIEEIMSNLDEKQRRKIKVNCVFQKGGIESFDSLLQMLECVGSAGICELRGISMLPLTPKAIQLAVDITPIMKSCEQFLNDGYLYDKDMCCCFEFLYLTDLGVPVKCILRNTFNNHFSCVKQFVYDGEKLYDGFLKSAILA